MLKLDSLWLSKVGIAQVTTAMATFVTVVTFLSYRQVSKLNAHKEWSVKAEKSEKMLEGIHIIERNTHSDHVISRAHLNVDMQLIDTRPSSTLGYTPSIKSSSDAFYHIHDVKCIQN